MPLATQRFEPCNPATKPYKVSDFDGLFITVKPNGSRLWHFKYRIDGKEKLLSIRDVSGGFIGTSPRRA